jgi:hypothetical protein
MKIPCSEIQLDRRLPRLRHMLPTRPARQRRRGPSRAQSCGAQLTFRRSSTPHIDSCGFESYSFVCSECAAPLGGVVDPCDNTLLLCELMTPVR